MRKTLSGLFVLSVLLLQGCATSIQYNYKYQPDGIKPSFSLTDDRPDIDKKGEILSAMITNDQYGIMRLGDNQVIPDRILYLKEQLDAKARDKLSSRNIEVTHFAIYNNMHAYLKRSATLGALTGGLGVLVDSAVGKKTGDAFIVTELGLTVDSTQYSSRITTPYSINKISGIDKDDLAKNIKLSMDQAIDDLISKM